MSAEPLSADPGPADPAQILHALPESLQAQFLAEYRQAVDQARDPACYPALRDLLDLWRLHAFALSEPGYADRLAAASVSDGREISLADIVAARPGK